MLKKLFYVLVLATGLLFASCRANNSCDHIVNADFDEVTYTEDHINTPITIKITNTNKGYSVARVIADTSLNLGTLSFGDNSLAYDFYTGETQDYTLKVEVIDTDEKKICFNIDIQR